MAKFDGVLLVSDFDDTLYDHFNRIPPRNRGAIDYFQRHGGRFTVATGRAHRTFAPYAQLVRLNAPVVLSNGAALYDFDGENLLLQTYLPHSAREDILQTVAQFPALGLECYHDEDIYVHSPNSITYGHLTKVGTGYELMPIEQMPVPWTKVIFQQEHGILQYAQQWFLARYGDFYEAIFSNEHYLEITCKGSTKGTMVAEMARRLGIAPQHVYCVGDNQNDIPMLNFASLGFAPSNCAKPVLDCGAEILCHCNEGVIGDIVDILDKRYT